MLVDNKKDPCHCQDLVCHREGHLLMVRQSTINSEIYATVWCEIPLKADCLFVVDDSPEVTPVTKHQGRQSDRAQSQLSQQSRQHHHHVSVSESDSSNVSTPETVRTSRVVGRRKSAVSDTGNRGTPAVPSRLNSSVDGELELALAMSRQSATRDSRVPGSTKPTRVETKQASHDSAPPERDGDLELALRLSLLGSCLEGMLPFVV